ncbi:MAG: T9SS type A sorting domain-containing protein [Elusimicrobia bacterium]|nr:T9SS type A sorting domain-containing protein [Elusimicrobiota bacterium]
MQCYLTQPGHITLKIYNTRGGLVATLADGEYPQGSSIFYWSGVDKDTSPVGSGIYIVHMKSGGFSGTKKIVIVK